MWKVRQEHSAVSRLVTPHGFRMVPVKKSEEVQKHICRVHRVEFEIEIEDSLSSSQIREHHKEKSNYRERAMRTI
jgi:hypothetical protein